MAFSTQSPAVDDTSTVLNDTPRRRLSTETKASFKTTELFAYLGAVVGVLLASQLIGAEDGHEDYFRADRAWFFVVLLTIGYLISRGIAKSGSRDYYDAR
jgi:hypothetical protein